MQVSFFTALIIFTAISCNSNSSFTQQPLNESINGMANTDYPAAFTGQTRIARVVTATPYKVEKLNNSLGRTWAIINFPGNRFLVTEKSGYMLLLDEEGQLLKKITGLPHVIDSGQGGLLDVALDPQFDKNQTVYWAFSEPTGELTTTAIAKGQLAEGDSTIKNATVIFRATPGIKSFFHYGSRLLFDKEGNLLVTMGERYSEREKAQSKKYGLGKIFRITAEGKAAAGNPFIHDKEALPEVYTYGHRNPQSLAMHPVTGDIWEAEFGPRGGDELNLIKPGLNYGWPVITYGIDYDGAKIGAAIQQKEGMEQPVYYWDPVISPSGMVFYTGNAIPEWTNNLFIASLSSTSLVRLIIENNKVAGEERLLKDRQERLRDVTEHNGMLYVVSDNGTVFRVSKK